MYTIQSFIIDCPSVDNVKNDSDSSEFFYICKYSRIT